MTSPTIWDLALVVVVVVVVGIAVMWVRHALPAYLVEKGKNLASKEDLEELTRKVEGVRTQYLSELERLRFDLGRASLVHKAQYETEFRVYEEIWQRVIDVQRTVVALRPMFDQVDSKESDEERRSRRVQEFAEPFNAMQAAIWKNKPFYSAAVHRELQELSQLFRGESIDYQHGDPHDQDYWLRRRRILRPFPTRSRRCVRQFGNEYLAVTVSSRSRSPMSVCLRVLPGDVPTAFDMQSVALNA